jgi:hypothetical protein
MAQASTARVATPGSASCLRSSSASARSGAGDQPCPLNEIVCWIPLGRLVYCIVIRLSGEKWISIAVELARHALGFAVPCDFVSWRPAADTAFHSDVWQRLRLPLPQ